MATDSNNYLLGTSTMPTTPNITPTVYTGLKFNGAGILDNIVIRNYVQTDTEADAVSICATQNWSPDILFMTVFNHSTDSSNLFGLTAPQTKWHIDRQETDSNILTNIAELNPNISTFTDFKCEGGGKSYRYLISAQNATQISAPLISEDVVTSFYGVFLIDAVNVDNGANNTSVVCYSFDMNTVVSAVSNVGDSTLYHNYTQYDNYFINSTDYLVGTVTSLLAYYDGNKEIEWNAQYLDDFRAFINNKQEKIMKFKNGSCIRCVTMTSTSESMNHTFNDGIVSTSGQSQLPTITFGFRECGKV